MTKAKRYAATKDLFEIAKQTCRTCRYAEFARTATGRIKRGEPGKCRYPKPELPVLPAAAETLSRIQYGWIWPRFDDCRVWAAKEPEEKM